jgi:HEPN domain
VTLDELFADGKLERVVADDLGAKQALAEARRHADSAETISELDGNGAYQLAYDGARKAVMAEMRREGIRVRRGEGAHALVAEYAALTIDAQLGQRLDAMRRRRNRSEYGSAYFGVEEVKDAVTTARALIEAVDR